jgi:hypothetical protein
MRSKLADERAAHINWPTTVFAEDGTIGRRTWRQKQVARSSTALSDLFQCLGIARARIAAGRLVRGDWDGLAATRPELIASLTLVSPMVMDTTELQALGPRLLVW